MDSLYTDQYNYFQDSSTAYSNQSQNFGAAAYASEKIIQSPGDQIYASRNELDSRKIFVGGLSWETTSDDLYRYFSQFGEVVDVNLKINAATNISRGFGFVLFSDADSVERCMDQPTHILHGRTIDPKRAMAEGSRELNSKVFVGGIDPNMTKEEIQEELSRYGKVEQIELPYDKVKNQRRAFGFVTFESEAVADVVCRSRKISLGRRKVDVRRLHSKDHPPQSMPPPTHTPATARGRGLPTRSPRPPFQSGGRGYVDQELFQTNGMFRSGCPEDDDDDFNSLQETFNTLAAVASSLSFPVPGFGFRGGRPPFSGRGGYGRGRRGGRHSGHGPGFHPYVR